MRSIYDMCRAAASTKPAAAAAFRRRMPEGAPAQREFKSDREPITALGAHESPASRRRWKAAISTTTTWACARPGAAKAPAGQTRAQRPSALSPAAPGRCALATPCAPSWTWCATRASPPPWRTHQSWSRARRVTEVMAPALQGALLVRHGPPASPSTTSWRAAARALAEAAFEPPERGLRSCEGGTGRGHEAERRADPGKRLAAGEDGETDPLWT